ncbi:MAG: alpha/beta hydrolase family protein, partial [Bryobacteraceae bacterium]
MIRSSGWACLLLSAAAAWGQDPAAEMVQGIHSFLDREVVRVAAQRREPDRERLRKIIGAVDPRIPSPQMLLDAAIGRSSLAAETNLYRVHAVRWPVLDGVEGEGLLLEPLGKPIASVVALPDADQTPEQLAGLAEGIPPQAQYARLLAESGCRVLVPVLIDRKDTWSGDERFRFTNQPHREFIYRMAYEMGRHIIGYEVQKTLAAVDWFTATAPSVPIGIAGYGEGGLIALHSAALDSRITSALVSGYFQAREQVWQEPIYRNVWSLLTEFGDAEIASLIAPRTLVIESSPGPLITGPPPETKDRRGAAPGQLKGPRISAVRSEYKRLQPMFEKRGAAERLSLAAGPAEALEALLRGLGVLRPVSVDARKPRELRASFDPEKRMRRQFDQLVEFTQKLLRRSEESRAAFWSKAEGRTSEWHRQYYWEEVIGRLPSPPATEAAQKHETGETAEWTRYNVKLPMWPGVFAYGVLLVPKDLK